MHEHLPEGGEVGRSKVREVAQLTVSVSMHLSVAVSLSPQHFLNKRIYLTR